MKTTSAVLGAVMLLGFAPPARAVEGLAVQWEVGESRVYSLQSRTLLPTQMRLQAIVNLDARVDQMWIDLVTTCTLDETMGKKRLLLVCTLDDVQVRAGVVAADVARAPKIIAEMDAALTGARVELQYMRDGRLRGLDLEGVDKSRPRLEEQHEVLRLLMFRTFAPLDVGMPKHGNDHGSAWSVRETQAIALPVQTGTLGKYKLQWKVDSVDGDVAALSSVAKGVVTGGPMVRAGQGEEPALQLEVEMEGSARFNTSTGVLLEHTYAVEGQHIASSIMAEQGRSLPYVHTSSGTYIPAGTTPAKVGPSGLLNNPPPAVTEPKAP